MRFGLRTGAVILGLAASASAQPQPETGVAPDSLADARELYEHRAEPAALAQAIVALEKLGTPPALALAAQAHLFRAEATLLHRRPRHDDLARTALETARTRARSAGADSPDALSILAAADEELAGLVSPLESTALWQEALATSAHAVALAPEAVVARCLHASALTALPARAGGDLGAARFEFERAIAASPSLLMPRVRMAATYAVKAQDRSLFHALLVAALSLDVTAVPELIPEQRLARARAIGLLHRERQLFRT
jgi:hypothetical protein